MNFYSPRNSSPCRYKLQGINAVEKCRYVNSPLTSRVGHDNGATGSARAFNIQDADGSCTGGDFGARTLIGSLGDGASTTQNWWHIGGSCLGDLWCAQSIMIVVLSLIPLCDCRKNWRCPQGNVEVGYFEYRVPNLIGEIGTTIVGTFDRETSNCFFFTRFLLFR